MPEDHNTRESLGRLKRTSRKRGFVEETPRLRAHRERRKRAIKNVLIATVLVAMIVVVGYATYAYVTIEQASNQMVDRDPKVVKVVEKVKPHAPFNLLLLGADYRPGDTKYRADTVILAHVDPSKKKVWLVSIPRDTKVTVPGRGTMKINAANYTGPSGMIEAVKGLTGLPINYYMEINFRGFQRIVDDIGGVWIDVPYTIDDWAAAGHSPGHRAKHIDKGYQKLDGEHALTFVRARHQFVDQDFSRMKDQQLFFKALAKQLAESKNNIFMWPTLIRHAAVYTHSNMPLGQMKEFADAMRGVSDRSIQTTTLKGEWKTPFIYTDEAWRDYVVNVIKRQGSFETSIPAGQVAQKPSDVSITIRNGAGIGGVAKEASDKLRAGGFNIHDVGNANQFVYDQTLVIYKDNVNGAQLVLNQLPVGRLVQSRGMYAFSSDVLVMVGKDWRIAAKNLPQAGQ